MQEDKVVKQFTSKKGNSVLIRYPKKEDLDDVLEFANNLVAEDTFIALNKPISREEEKKWLTDTLEKIKKREKIQLVVEVGGKYAGNCEIRRREKRQKHVGEIGISIAKEFREEGIGTVLLKALIDEGRALGLRLLILYCFEVNDRAIHVYEKLGFKRSGIVPGMYAYKGKYFSEMTMYKSL